MQAYLEESLLIFSLPVRGKLLERVVDTLLYAYS